MRRHWLQCCRVFVYRFLFEVSARVRLWIDLSSLDGCRSVISYAFDWQTFSHVCVLRSLPLLLLYVVIFVLLLLLLEEEEEGCGYWERLSFVVIIGENIVDLEGVDTSEILYDK